MIWDPGTPSQLKVTEDAARAMRINVQALPVRVHPDLAHAFELAKRDRAEAFNVLASPNLSSLQGQILDHVTRSRLPAIFQWKEHAVAGGLMTYGPSLAAMWQQAGQMALKILKGASPSTVPVEQPVKFELVINVRTAKALGVTVPRSLLLRADEVIQ